MSDLEDGPEDQLDAHGGDDPARFENTPTSYMRLWNNVKDLEKYSEALRSNAIRRQKPSRKRLDAHGSRHTGLSRCVYYRPLPCSPNFPTNIVCYVLTTRYHDRVAN